MTSEIVHLKTGAEWLPEMKAFIQKRLPPRNLGNHIAHVIASDHGEKLPADLTPPLGTIRLVGTKLRLHPIHLAALYGRVDILPLLGNPKGVKDVWNNTPLHYAALACQREAMKCLMGMGCEMKLQNKLGGTPAQYLRNVGPKNLTEVCGYPLISGDVHMDALMMLRWFLYETPFTKETLDPEENRDQLVEEYAAYKPSSLEIDRGRPDDEGAPMPPETGRRVFAKEDIPAKQIFTRYGGISYFRTSASSEEFNNDPTGDELGLYLGCGIDGALAGSPASLMAHGIPNAELVAAKAIDGWPEITMVRSLEPIPAGQEVVIHYGGHRVNYSETFTEPRVKALKDFLGKEDLSLDDRHSCRHVIETIPLFFKLFEEELVSLPRLREIVAIARNITREEDRVTPWVEFLSYFLRQSEAKIKEWVPLLHSAFSQIVILEEKFEFDFYTAWKFALDNMIPVMKMSIKFSGIWIGLNDEKTSFQVGFIG